MPYDTPYNRMIAKIENRANEDYAEHHAYSNQMYNTNRPFSQVYAEVKLPARPFLESVKHYSNHDGGITGVNGEGYCGGAYISRQMRHSRLGEDTRRPLFSAESASEDEESEEEGAGGCYSDEEEETENRIIGRAEPMKKEASKQKKELKSYEKKLKGGADKEKGAKRKARTPTPTPSPSPSPSPSPPPPPIISRRAPTPAYSEGSDNDEMSELTKGMEGTKLVKDKKKDKSKKSRGNDDYVEKGRKPPSPPASGMGASGGRKPSKWIEFVKKWAVENKMKYGDALRSPKLKADYAKHKTGGFAFLPILASALAPLAVKGVKSLVNKIRGNGENKSGGSVMGGPANDPVNRGKITGLGKKKGGKIEPDAKFYPPTGNYFEGASLGAGKKKGRGKAKKTGASLFLTPSVQPTDVKATPTVEDNMANLDEYVPVAGNGKRKRRTKKEMMEAKMMKTGGMLKSEMPGSSFSGGAKKPMSAWIKHVMAYQKAHGCSYKEAMKAAKASYKK